MKNWLLIFFVSCSFAQDLYQNNLKNLEFGKEALQNFDSEQTPLVEWQGPIEDRNFEAKPTQLTTDSPNYFGIDSNLAIQPLSIEDLEIPTPIFKPPEKSILISISLSSLFPGLGHVYLGEMKTATALMGSTAMSLGAFLLAPSMTTASNLQAATGYGLYSVYRDVRNYNGQSNYRYQMPTDSFADLTWASFQWSVIKKPEVWGGFLGAMGLAFTTAYFFYPDEARIQFPCAMQLDLNPIAAFPVGIGEESLFRGYLQSMLAESFNPTGAIVLSSLAFGAAHIPNALQLDREIRWRYYTFSLPLVTAFGAYFGWMTYKNHSLKESVALHCWYDFVLFAASYAASQAASTGPTNFALHLPF